MNFLNQLVNGDTLTDMPELRDCDWVTALGDQRKKTIDPTGMNNPFFKNLTKNISQRVTSAIPHLLEESHVEIIRPQSFKSF